MIRIHKPDTPPERLRRRGPDKRRSHSVSFARDPAAYRSGERTFDFDENIYSASSVKSALIEAQNKKCCFCESKVSHIAYGDVEHFRPKAGYRQHAEQSLQRPGYYWLAYEWSNLFFCCQICNQRFKKNLFPLQNPEERATSHRDEVQTEEPVFLHPGRDEPEAHIGFREAVAFAEDGSECGGRTIAALQLNRDDLYEVRRDYYYSTFKELIFLLEFLETETLTQQRRQEARRLAKQIIEQNRKEAERDEKPYASMLRDAIARFEEQVS